MTTVDFKLNKAQIAVIGAALIGYLDKQPFTQSGINMIDELIEKCEKEFDLLPDELMSND